MDFGRTQWRRGGRGALVPSAPTLFRRYVAAVAASAQAGVKSFKNIPAVADFLPDIATRWEDAALKGCPSLG